MRDLHGAAPEVLHRETGGGRWAGEDVMGGVRGGAALGTQVGIRDVDCMSVGVEAGTLPRPQLGQGGAEVAGEGCFRGRDDGGGPEQDLTWASIGEVARDDCGMNISDGRPVVLGVDCSVELQVPGDSMVDGGLEEGYSGSRAGVLGDQGVGRVGRSQRACEKLGAEHCKVVGKGEGFGFGVEVLNV